MNTPFPKNLADNDALLPRTEKEKMLAGEGYNAADPLLTAERRRARLLSHQLNTLSPEAHPDEKRALLAALLSQSKNNATTTITPPFFCDYGYNIVLGENVYFNFNCVILDITPVHIGSNTMFGPGAQIYTAEHPLSASERRTGIESGRSVFIGDDVWIGGGVIICPGVTIGSGTVIGAGSVVTRDIPANVLAAGNPCRVIRSLNTD